MNDSLTIAFPSMWEEVKRVKGRVLDHLKDFDRELQDATVITVSELTENAIKYGEPVPGLAQSRLELQVAENTITVTVRNGVTVPERADEVQRHIQSIADAPDRREIYLRRLREMLANPTQPGSKLGLYRIGYEGQYDLACTYEDNILTITATRRLQ